MATTTSAWAKAGAWALDSEEHEEEQQQVETSDFPSLSAAAVTNKTKKKKAQITKTVSLFEFTTGKTGKGLSPTELLNLPTGPRERSAEELQSSSSLRLGGAFKSYGGGGGGVDDSSSRWGRGDESSRRNNREPPPPSKADEVDDWGAAKRSLPHRASAGGGGGGFFDSPQSGTDTGSRADESDSWVSKKSFVPSSDSRRIDRERRGIGFDNGGGAGRADSDNWGSTRKREGGGDCYNNNNTGRPRLVLQPRSLSTTNAEQQLQQPPSDSKTNPFGAARPREQVLADKGQDWKKIDEKLESLKIKENDHWIASPSSNSWRKPASPTPSEKKEDRDGENIAAEN